MTTYRVGLIGCGNMGTEHGQGYGAHPQTEIVAIADPNRGNLDAFGDRFGVPNRYSGYEDLLAHEDIDIAAVTVPVKVNPRIVLACAAAGAKGIFCEKPIAASLREADDMVQACQAGGIPLACGAIWRNHPYMQTARQVIADGEIGQVSSINCYSASGEISGGGCHSLNVVRLLAGDSDVDWVIGWMAGDPNSDDDQGAGGYLRFVNGVDVFLHHRAGIKSGVEVIGEHGILFWDWRNIHLWKTYTPWQDSAYHNLQPAPFPYPRLSAPGIYPAITGGIQSVIDCIKRGGEPLCSGDDMRKVLEIAIALRESHRRDHTPVSLPIEDRMQKIVPTPYRWLGESPTHEG